MYRSFLKRGLDIVVASAGLLLISPLFIFIFLVLVFVNNGKPFFYQKRPGYKEKIFGIIKFKTMSDKKSPEGKLLPDRQRLTRAGSFLRKTSLDELPQLLNVVIGTMSLIGPRPLLINYLPFYTTLERKRHDVRPGITGWAQVNGRNTLSWDKRLEYDVYYAENLNFMLDMKIVYLTIKNVFMAKDISIVPGEQMKNLDAERRR